MVCIKQSLFIDSRAGRVNLKLKWPLSWVYWFNTERLLEPLGYVSPLEFEKRYYDRLVELAIAA